MSARKRGESPPDWQALHLPRPPSASKARHLPQRSLALAREETSTLRDHIGSCGHLDLVRTQCSYRREDGGTCGHHVVDDHHPVGWMPPQTKHWRAAMVVATGPSSCIKGCRKRTYDGLTGAFGKLASNKQCRVDPILDASRQRSWNGDQRKGWNPTRQELSSDPGQVGHTAVLEQMHETAGCANMLERRHHPQAPRKETIRARPQRPRTPLAQVPLRRGMTGETDHARSF